jgi:glycosyltransferase involved in cell wall biosynthesis
MERVVQLLCNSTRDRIDNEVLVANTSRATVRDDVAGIPVTRAAQAVRVGSIPVCPSFLLGLRRSRADVIVIHEPNPMALVAYRVSARRQQPLIVWHHSDVIRAEWMYRAFYQPLARYTLRRASRIAVSSPNLRDHAREVQHYRHKCVVIPFGIDVNRLRDSAQPPAWLREFRLRCPGPFALTVGRMVRYKGVDHLLRALAGTGMRAVVIGDGPELPHYRSLTVSLGLHDSVLFPGSVPDEELTAAYHACDMFVLPAVTSQETFGMVQLEAMACGKPVISTNLPTGVPWVNVHERTGIIVPPGDALALRQAMLALGSSPERRSEMGAQGRDRVAQEFTLEAMARRVVTLYEDVVGEHQARVATGLYPAMVNVRSPQQ